MRAGDGKRRQVRAQPDLTTVASQRLGLTRLDNRTDIAVRADQYPAARLQAVGDDEVAGLVLQISAIADTVNVQALYGRGCDSARSSVGDRRPVRPAYQLERAAPAGPPRPSAARQAHGRRRQRDAPGPNATEFS